MENKDRPRVAIIGTGVSGLSCAWGLRDIADLTLFESEKRPGGHTNTVTVEEDGCAIPIDTGFIVFNKVTYPHLCRLFDELGIAIKPTSSILTARPSINRAGEPTEVVTKGRHDPCVGIRATPIAEAMLAMVVMEHVLQHRAQCGDVVQAMPRIAAQR
jgi:uncharacterized protein with NAD-binding domain and iron-sulfur cluster